MKKLVRITTIMAIILFQTYVIMADASDIITYKSELVWRPDGKGDFLLSDEKNRTITADGIIETVSVSWEFEGEVSLEISFDKGASYYKVVNGVPVSLRSFASLRMTSGASPAKAGKNLTWRAKLTKGSELKGVCISYTDSAGVRAGFGRPELSGFKYRKAVDIRGSVEEVFNYEMKVGVSEILRPLLGPQNDKGAGSQNDKGAVTRHPEGGQSPTEGTDAITVQTEANFRDVRFTTEDGRTLLPFFLEDMLGTSPARTAFFWVKIPQIPIDGLRIYVYYGNAEAENLSNQEAVFGPGASGEDSARVRNYVEVEPEVISEKDQEEVKLPLFLHTELSPDGNVLLKEGYQKGVYVTEITNIPFRARILVPNWEGDGFVVDVSADGYGYKKNCDKERYYYAAHKDFGPGEYIKLRARFTREMGLDSSALSGPQNDDGGAGPQNDTSIRHSEGEARRTSLHNDGLKLLEVDFAPGVITLVTPNGREEWRAGTKRDILWSAWEYDFFYLMKIVYSEDRGRTYTEIAKAENDGLYSWDIPLELAGKELIVRVQDANDESIGDSSDEVFTVK